MSRHPENLQCSRNLLYDIQIFILYCQEDSSAIEVPSNPQCTNPTTCAMQNLLGPSFMRSLVPNLPVTASGIAVQARGGGSRPDPLTPASREWIGALQDQVSPLQYTNCRYAPRNILGGITAVVVCTTVSIFLALELPEVDPMDNNRW
jgi:hypothetical protein